MDRFWMEPKFPGYEERAAYLIPRLKAQLDTFNFPHDDFWVEVMFSELMMRGSVGIPAGCIRRLVRDRLHIQERLPPREPIVAKWNARKLARAISRATKQATAAGRVGRL